MINALGLTGGLYTEFLSALLMTFVAVLILILISKWKSTDANTGSLSK